MDLMHIFLDKQEKEFQDLRIYAVQFYIITYKVRINFYKKFSCSRALLLKKWSDTSISITWKLTRTAEVQTSSRSTEVEVYYDHQEIRMHINKKYVLEYVSFFSPLSLYLFFFLQQTLGQLKQDTEHSLLYSTL